MRNLFEISREKQANHMGHTGKKENEAFKFVLLFLGLFLNMQKDMFGYNFSFSDVATICLVILFLAAGNLVIEVKTMFFFLVLLTVSLLVGTFYIPEKYHFAISINSYVSDYLKVIASFVYLTLGINIAMQKKEEYVLKGYTFMAMILAVISILAIIFQVSLFNIEFFFFGDRFIGLLNDPNYFAVAQCGCLALLLFDTNLKESRKGIWSCVVVISILFSASKTGFVTMAVVLLLFTLLQVNKLKRKTIISFTIISSFVISVVWIYPEKIAASYFYLLDKYPILNRIAVLFSDGSAAISEGGSSRQTVWEGGLAVIRENSILGVGIGRYLNVVEKISGIGFLAHNTYIQIISEWGLILGIILFFTCFYVCIVNLLKGNRRLAAFFLVWLIGSLSISLNNSRIFWITLGFLFAITIMNVGKQHVSARELVFQKRRMHNDSAG